VEAGRGAGAVRVVVADAGVVGVVQDRPCQGGRSHLRPVDVEPGRRAVVGGGNVGVGAKADRAAAGQTEAGVAARGQVEDKQAAAVNAQGVPGRAVRLIEDVVGGVGVGVDLDPGLDSQGTAGEIDGRVTGGIGQGDVVVNAVE